MCDLFQIQCVLSVLCTHDEVILAIEMFTGCVAREGICYVHDIVANAISSVSFKFKNQMRTKNIGTGGHIVVPMFKRLK